MKTQQPANDRQIKRVSCREFLKMTSSQQWTIHAVSVSKRGGFIVNATRTSQTDTEAERKAGE